MSFQRESKDRSWILSQVLLDVPSIAEAPNSILDFDEYFKIKDSNQRDKFEAEMRHRDSLKTYKAVDSVSGSVFDAQPLVISAGNCRRWQAENSQGCARAKIYLRTGQARSRANRSRSQKEKSIVSRAPTGFFRILR